MQLFRIRAKSPEQPKSGGLVLFTSYRDVQVVHVADDGRETDITANIEALSVDVSAGKALSATIRVAGVELDLSVDDDNVTKTVVAPRDTVERMEADAVQWMNQAASELGLPAGSSPKAVAFAIRQLIAKTQ